MRGGARTGAGRPSGARNRKALQIEERLAELGIDPILGMALIASNNKGALGIEEDVPIPVRAQMYKELASYVAFKLKAVEVLVGDRSIDRHEDRLKHLR